METRQQRMFNLLQRRRRELLVWYRDRYRPEAKERQRLSTPVKVGGLLAGCESFHVAVQPRNGLKEKTDKLHGTG